MDGTTSKARSADTKAHDSPETRIVPALRASGFCIRLFPRLTAGANNCCSAPRLTTDAPRAISESVCRGMHRMAANLRHTDH